jgi:HD-GYP domain-containing protein (c-di-GMP phosphodiesterase class II)
MLASAGWTPAAAALGAVIVLIALQVVFQVRREIQRLYHRSNVIRQAAEDAEKHYIQVLWRIVRFVEAREKYTRGHSERVAALCGQIAEKMSLSPQQCSNLETAGMLHDLGMFVVSEKIRLQCHRLSEEVYQTIRKHPEVAYEILKPLPSLQEILPAIRYHHERMNGTGYPSGLVGEDIPLEARILAVADAYDAMTHDRSHRPAMSPLTAIQELRRCAPDGYDPTCLEALAELKNIPKLQEALCSS